jgi:MltA specific insert domain
MDRARGLIAIQIEGSARVILEDGTPLRISYDSHNGYRYSSIERVLIERNLISRQEMSPQRVRDWMASGGGCEYTRYQPLLCVLPHYRTVERGRTSRCTGGAVDAGPVHCRR